MEIKFPHQSRAITLLKMNKKYCSIIQIYILSISMHIQNLIEIHKLIHKILSINKTLMLIKGHNSVKNWPKITCIGNNMALSCIYQCIYKIWSKFINWFWRYWGINKTLMLIKGHNSVKNWPKITCIGNNMDLVYINAYTKFDLNSSAGSEDIEKKHIFTRVIQ